MRISPLDSFATAQAQIPYIQQVATQPYSLKGQPDATPKWQETIVINENYLGLVSVRSCMFPIIVMIMCIKLSSRCLRRQAQRSRPHSQDDCASQGRPALLFFELVDTLPVHRVLRTQQRGRPTDGWRRVAWAFFPLVDANGVATTESRVRLQFFRYSDPEEPLSLGCLPRLRFVANASPEEARKRQEIRDCFEKLADQYPTASSAQLASFPRPHVFDLWADVRARRRTYPCSLHVTISGIRRPVAEAVQRRPLWPTQTEVGTIPFEELYARSIMAAVEPAVSQFGKPGSLDISQGPVFARAQLPVAAAGRVMLNRHSSAFTTAVSPATSQACRIPATPLAVLPSGGLGTSRVTFSPSGRWLATVSPDRLDHDRGYAAATAAANRSAAATTTHNLAGAVESSAGRRPTAGMRLGPANAASVATHLSADALVSCPCPVRIYDTSTGNLQAVYRGHESFVYDVAFAPNQDDLVATCSADGIVLLWLASSAVTIFRVPHPCFTYALAWMPMNLQGTLDHVRTRWSTTATLAVGGFDRIIRLWNIPAASDALRRAAEGLGHQPSLASESIQQGDRIQAICFDREGIKMFTGDAAGVVSVWLVDRAVFECTLMRQIQAPASSEAITGLQVHPQGRHLLVHTSAYVARVLDLGNYSFVITVPSAAATSCPLPRACYSPCGRFILTGAFTERRAHRESTGVGQSAGSAVVTAWDAFTGREVAAVSHPRMRPGLVCDIAYHPSFDVVALAAYGPGEPVAVCAAHASVDPPPSLEQNDDETVGLGASMALSELPLTSGSTWKTMSRPPEMTTMKSQARGAGGDLLARGEAILRQVGHPQREVGEDNVGMEIMGGATASAAWVPGACVQILYDYKPQNDDELPLRAGETLIAVHATAAPGWWEGLNEHGVRGLFPVNYAAAVVTSQDM
jgi:WD40 repeat protein